MPRAKAGYHLRAASISSPGSCAQRLRIPVCGATRAALGYLTSAVYSQGNHPAGNGLALCEVLAGVFEETGLLRCCVARSRPHRVRWSTPSSQVSSREELPHWACGYGLGPQACRRACDGMAPMICAPACRAEGWCRAAGRVRPNCTMSRLAARSCTLGKRLHYVDFPVSELIRAAASSRRR